MSACRSILERTSKLSNLTVERMLSGDGMGGCGIDLCNGFKYRFFAPFGNEGLSYTFKNGVSISLEPDFDYLSSDKPRYR